MDRIYKELDMLTLCRFRKRNISRVLFFLITISCLGRVWIVGHDPGDLPNAEIAVNDSAGIGDTVYVKPGIWCDEDTGLIFIDDDKTFSGFPGANRDSILLYYSISLAKGHLSNMTICPTLGYFHVGSYFDKAVMDSCRIQMVIELTVEWAPIPYVNTDYPIIIRDCIIQPLLRMWYPRDAKIGLYITSHDDYYYIYPDNIFIYRNTFIECDVGIYSTPEFPPFYSYCPEFDITNNYWGTTDSAYVDNHIFNSIDRWDWFEYSWYPFLEFPFESLTSFPSDTLEFPGVRYNNFLDCDIFADCWASTDIHENKEDISNEIKIYPQPIKANIVISGNQMLSSFDLFDITGRRVLSNRIDDYRVNINIDEKVNNGVYFYILRTKESKTKTGRLIIVR